MSLLLLFACALPPEIREAPSAEARYTAIVGWCDDKHDTCRERLERRACRYAGGSWVRFTDGCRDLCWSQRSAEPPMCTADTPMGCECGPDRCFDGVTCQPL